MNLTSKEEQECDPTGRYIKTTAELGRGAYKVVYRAIDRDLGIEVAWNEIKIIQDANFDNLWKEIAILKLLSHPNVLVCHNSWIDEKKYRVIFITECMTSGTLKQFIQKAKSVKLKVIKNWCIQILEGLKYLHSLDPPIIHRDIKCDNIFIDGNSGKIKIGDLGLATSILRNCSGNKLSIIGTPEFMAPEYYEEDYNEKVDIWAFGMCILEMTTLEYPYVECENPAQIFKKVIHGHLPRSLERIKDKDVYNFVNECLKPIEQRKSAEELLNHQFLKNLDDESNNRTVSLIEAAFPPITDRISKEKSSSMDSIVDDFQFITKSQSLNIHPMKNEKEKKITVDESYSSKIKPILVDSPGDDTNQKDIDITIHPAAETDESSHNILTLGLSLGVVGSKDVTYVEFEYHQGHDTPLDVSKEMVRELDLSETSVEDISEYIEAKVEEYFENLEKNSNKTNDDEIQKGFQPYVKLKRSYSEGQPLIVARRRDLESLMVTTSPLKCLIPKSLLSAPDASVKLDELDELVEVAGTSERNEANSSEVLNFKIIAESNNASCDAALKAFEKEMQKMPECRNESL